MSLSAVGLWAKAFEIGCMSAVRVMVSPALAIVVAIAFKLPPVFTIALVSSFSLPAAKMVLPLARKQGVYVEQTAGIITMTTLSLLVVWPVVIWICEQLWPGVVAAHG